jgi:hypothetical protein
MTTRKELIMNRFDLSAIASTGAATLIAFTATALLFAVTTVPGASAGLV